LLTAQRQQAVLPLGWISTQQARHPSGCFSTTLPEVSRAWVEPVRSLLEAPSPAVLTTYRKDGSAHTVPVWFRWTDEAFEVVIAKGDVKLRHLARDPRCVLVVFEAVRPFRGLEVRGVGEGDLTSARAAIAGRYLGVGDGERFAAERRSTPGVLLRLVPNSSRVWDLSGILPR
jgi:PPOX class probable F420-dependent enzyme